MPWRGPEEPGEFPTLGYQVADLIEARCAVPDGDRRGEPYRLTDEMVRFLLWHYRLDPATGRFAYSRGSQLVRPQKWGKGPFSASLICAECDPEGPVLFDGWDAAGEPVGRPWATPWCQVTAVSEDQTDNVWKALVPMIELGALSADIPDTGETRINLPGGGFIEPVTSSARSRLGQRITFAVQDETHSWVERNGGRQLARNQRRNLAGMGGRFLETTNAWSPAEASVAQGTSEHPVGVHADYPKPPAGSVKNKRERRKVMQAVYGDSWLRPGQSVDGWVDLDRIDEEIEALLHDDPVQAERFFLNRDKAGSSTAFDLGKWEAQSRPGLTVPDGSLIVVGVDGARFDDALAIIATDVASGHQWPLSIIERPPDAPDSYEHDLAQADGAMVEAFSRYQVWRAYCDPQWIDGLVDLWAGRWGQERVVSWYMNRPRQVAYAVRNYRTAIGAQDFTNDGDPAMARHIGNAHRQPMNVKDDEGRPMWGIQKDRPGSPNKIDAAAAGTISWEARGDAVAAGAQKREEAFVPRRIH